MTADAEGIGSIIGFFVGPYVVQLHTTLPDEQDPLVAPQDLTALASTVLEQLASPK